MQRPTQIRARNRFKLYLKQELEHKYVKLVKSKRPDRQYLTFRDFQRLTSFVRKRFKKALGTVPGSLEFACLSSEAVLAPGLEQKKQLVIKMGKLACGGAAGVAAILAGLAGIFGWGAGVVASIHAFFFGVSLAGPIALIASGVVVAAIAGYWALTSDDRTNSSRAYRALQSGCANAVDAIWAEYGDALAKTATSIGMKKKRKAVARRPTMKVSKEGVLAKP